jgi:hypothetical protein
VNRSARLGLVVGLGLAMSARLIENQRCTVEAKVAEGLLDYVIGLPLVTPGPVTPVEPATQVSTVTHTT